jgi:type I restriction enzyme S subunit
MNAQSFLDNFHVIARAPGGIRRVRDLVYFFAITGGLSGPEIGDSDAQLILDDSLQAKLNYYEENSVRQGARKHSEIFQVVKRVPSHWVMVATGDLVHLINGRAFKSTDWKKSGLPIIRIQNLNNPSAPFNYFQGEVAEGHRVRIEDMLLSWSGTPGTSFGAFIWNGGDAVLNQHIFKVAIYSTKISKEYLRMAINASLDALIGSARGGVGLKHVTKGQIESLQIPLPPLEEQKRIVAKVDELMRLCDRLEVQQQEREKLLPLLASANHTRFVAEPTSINLQAIFHRPGVALSNDLRKTLSDLAITGLLSRPVAGDSDAKLILDDSLRAKIEYYEENSVRQGARKHSEIFQVVKRVPSHWAMVAAGDLVHLINGRAFKADDWKKSGLPIIRIQNLNNPTAPFNYFHGEVAEGHRVRTGDMLLSWSGTPGTSFGAFIWNGGDAVLNQHIFKVAIYSTKISKEYLRMAINASLDALIGSARGGVGLKHVTKGQIESLQIPLPPLEEQNRILAKLNELMRLCDRLENQTTERLSVSEAFARAAVAAITSTESTESETMKPPKTEVVTSLKVGSRPKKSDMAPLTTLLLAQKAEVSAKTLWQLSGLDIDAFYRQLKTEMANGWIEETHSAFAREQIDVGQRINELKAELGWEDIDGAAKEWLDKFEHENRYRPELVLQLLDKLRRKKLTIAEFIEKNSFNLTEFRTVTQAIPNIDHATIERFLNE